MHPTYTFKVNVLNYTNIYSSPIPNANIEAILQQLKQATIWIEGVDRPLKHGDTFTVSGELAVRIKRMYQARRELEIIDENVGIDPDPIIPEPENPDDGEFFIAEKYMLGALSGNNLQENSFSLFMIGGETDSYVKRFNHLKEINNYACRCYVDGTIYQLSFLTTDLVENQLTLTAFSEDGDETIELSGDIGDVNSILSMTYYSLKNYILFSSNSGTYKLYLSPLGVVSKVSETGSSSMFIYNNDLYFFNNLDNDKFSLLNPIDLEPILDETETPIVLQVSYGGGTVNVVSGTVLYEGSEEPLVYCIFEATNEVSQNFFGVFNPNVGTITAINFNIGPIWHLYTDATNSFYGIGSANDGNGAVIKDAVYKFEETLSFQEKLSFNESDDPASIAWNQDDGLYYHMAYRDYDYNNSIVFEKMTFDGNIENIELSGFIYQEGLQIEIGDNFIGDGKDDMYDSGNILMTGNSATCVVYTHVKNSNSDAEYITYDEDPAIADGDTWFGAGSQYYTCLYPKLFFMGANSVNINEFWIDGELGADGAGYIRKHEYTQTSNGRTYNIFFKKVFGSGDPSVNHLIIIRNDNGVGITHTISPDTDQDYDNIIGMNSDCNELYYLLFAAQDEDENGYEVPLEDAQTISQAFLDMVSNLNNITAVKTAMSTGHTTITDLIPNSDTFTDYSNEDTVYIKEIYGIDNPGGMVYYKNNIFLVASGTSLYQVTTDGYVTPVGGLGAEINGLTFHNGKLYGCTNFSPSLIEFDPETGIALNEVPDQKYDIFLTVDGNPANIVSIASVNDNLKAIIQYDGGYAIGICDLDSQTITVESTKPHYISLTGAGTDPVRLEEFYYSYVIDDIGYVMPRVSKNKSLEPTLEQGLQAQYNETVDYSYPYPQEGWVDVEILDIVDFESYWGIVLDLPYGNYSVRLRFNPEVPSAWTYAFQD